MDEISWHTNTVLYNTDLTQPCLALRGERNGQDAGLRAWRVGSARHNVFLSYVMYLYYVWRHVAASHHEDVRTAMRTPLTGALTTMHRDTRTANPSAGDVPPP